MQKRTDLTTYTKHFSDVGQRVYEENRKRCRKSYKLSEAVEFIEDVEKEISENKLSEIMSRFKGYENVAFKSITGANGSEFSALTETFSGTHIYYAHPYSSFERGTNEKQNSLLRSFFKKGTDFDKIGDEAIRKFAINKAGAALSEK